MRALLPTAIILATLAACESPTAPRGLNPQPLPPGLHAGTSFLNPQPLPPGLHSSGGTSASFTCKATRLDQPPDPCFGATTALNPQPLPPGLQSSTTTTTSLTCKATRLYEPPDPCLQ